MRVLLILWVLFPSVTAAGQGDSISLTRAVRALDIALLQKDSAVLAELLHKEIAYGHSNGWIENKKEVWDDLKSGKLVYDKIEANEIEISSISKERAVLRMKIAVGGSVNDKKFEMNLSVMQVWVWEENRWRLFARQSVKL